jgi:DNA-binding IclR family transcriptional regulator
MTIATPVSTQKTTPTGTVSRALRLLALLADADGPVTIKYVSQEMGLAPSTVHRLLGLLKDEGFVADVLETRSYDIGPQFYRVSAQVINGASQLDLISNVLEDLAATHNETILFGQYLPTENSLSFAVRCDGQQKLLYQIDMHKPLSLVWGASGKAILAQLPEYKVAEILDHEGNAPGNGAKPPDFDTLIHELRDIRRAEYCVSYGEKLPGSRGIAAPLFDRSGIIGSICLTAPESRNTDGDIDRIGQSLAQSARQLSHDLGAKL